jgi:hypothetical protein
MFDQVVADLEMLAMTEAQWQVLRKLAGLTNGAARTLTPRSHIMWLRRKEKKGGGIDYRHTALHRAIHELAQVHRV